VEIQDWHNILNFEQSSSIFSHKVIFIYRNRTFLGIRFCKPDNMYNFYKFPLAPPPPSPTTCRKVVSLEGRQELASSGQLLYCSKPISNSWGDPDEFIQIIKIIFVNIGIFIATNWKVLRFL